MFHIPKIRDVRVRQDGKKVILIEEGKAILTLPWEVALELSNAMRAQAKRAEELDKAKQIIGDQALLIRKGVPLGLSNHPSILKEATKEAVHNKFLRRAIPFSKGVESQEIFGTPSIIKKSPKEKSDDKL